MQCLSHPSYRYTFHCIVPPVGSLPIKIRSQLQSQYHGAKKCCLSLRFSLLALLVFIQNLYENVNKKTSSGYIVYLYVYIVGNYALKVNIIYGPLNSRVFLFCKKNLKIKNQHCCLNICLSAQISQQEFHASHVRHLFLQHFYTQSVYTSQLYCRPSINRSVLT